jgi:hypothetical protein
MLKHHESFGEFDRCIQMLSKIRPKANPFDKEVIKTYMDLYADKRIYKLILSQERRFMESLQKNRNINVISDSLDQILEELEKVNKNTTNTQAIQNLQNALINEIKGIKAWNLDHNKSESIQFITQSSKQYFSIYDYPRCIRAIGESLIIYYDTDYEYLLANNFVVDDNGIFLRMEEVTSKSEILEDICDTPEYKFAMESIRRRTLEKFLIHQIPECIGISIHRHPVGTRIIVHARTQLALSEERKEELIKVIANRFSYENPSLEIEDLTGTQWKVSR